jgi:FtsP/CotA-like multicopper oxidase with cupredoxin domain
MNVVGGLAGGYCCATLSTAGSNPLYPTARLNCPLWYKTGCSTPTARCCTRSRRRRRTGRGSAEYFGDVMMVNGKIWPTLTVQPAVYRFRLLNGCKNARILSLRIASRTIDHPDDHHRHGGRVANLNRSR